MQFLKVMAETLLESLVSLEWINQKHMYMQGGEPSRVGGDSFGRDLSSVCFMKLDAKCTANMSVLLREEKEK